MTTEIVWMDDPEDHDFAAAGDFLELLTVPQTATRIIDELQAAPTIRDRWKAKDILRAVGPDSNPLIALLPQDNEGVAHKLRHIGRGEPISPVLLVRDLAARSLLIVDGDHRVAAAYWMDENSTVPCRIVDWERD